MKSGIIAYASTNFRTDYIAVVKPSSTSRASINTPFNDPHLLFTPEANAIYQYNMLLNVNLAAGTAGMRGRFVLGAGGTSSALITAVRDTVNTLASFAHADFTTLSTLDLIANGGGRSGLWIVQVRGIITTVNSSVVNFQWAQDQSSTIATILESNSYLEYRRIR
ncbi:MAG: hypothetical protein ACRC78_03000 [Planktothrix sp.]